MAVDGSKNSSTGGALSDQGVSTEDSAPDAGVLCEVRLPVTCCAIFIYTFQRTFYANNELNFLLNLNTQKLLSRLLLLHDRGTSCKDISLQDKKYDHMETTLNSLT